MQGVKDAMAEFDRHQVGCTHKSYFNDIMLVSSDLQHHRQLHLLQQYLSWGYKYKQNKTLLGNTLKKS